MFVCLRGRSFSHEESHVLVQMIINAHIKVSLKVMKSCISKHSLLAEKINIAKILREISIDISNKGNNVDNNNDAIEDNKDNRSNNSSDDSCNNKNNNNNNKGSSSSSNIKKNKSYY